MERKEVCIQKGDAEDVERHDTKLNSKGWGDFIVGKDPQDALEQLVEAINNNEVDTDGSFFRLKIDQKTIINL